MIIGNILFFFDFGVVMLEIKIGLGFLTFDFTGDNDRGNTQQQLGEKQFLILQQM